jgi:hypothetical protein
VHSGVYHRVVKSLILVRVYSVKRASPPAANRCTTTAGAYASNALPSAVACTGRRSRLGKEVPGTGSGVFSMDAMSPFVSTPSRTVAEGP